MQECIEDTRFPSKRLQTHQSMTCDRCVPASVVKTVFPVESRLAIHLQPCRPGRYRCASSYILTVEGHERYRLCVAATSRHCSICTVQHMPLPRRTMNVIARQASCKGLFGAAVGHIVGCTTRFATQMGRKWLGVTADLEPCKASLCLPEVPSEVILFPALQHEEAGH